MHPVTDPQPLPSTPAPERRAAARFPTIQRCVAWPAREADAAGWRGIVFDLSAAGVGVALPVPLPPGTELLVQAWGREARPLVGMVVRTACVEGVWFTGCELATPLTEQDLGDWTGLPPGPGWDAPPAP
jgi:hypothetical protein